MEILPWDGISLLFLLVVLYFLQACCSNGNREAQKEGGKEIISILLGGSCLVLGLRLCCSSVSGSLGGALALPGAEVSEPRAVPQGSAVLHCTGSLQGQKPLAMGERVKALRFKSS